MGFGDAWYRLWTEIRRADRRREVDEELALHVDLLAARFESEGLSPEVARRKALRRFGDVRSVAKRVRKIDGGRHRRRRRREMGGALKLDVLYAWRQLVESPALTVAAGLTLALGIGVNVAMFSLLDAVVLQRLPYPEPDRLVAVWPAKNMNMSMVDVFDAEVPAFSGIAGRSYWALTLLGDDGRAPAVVNAAAVRTNFFEVLGVQPMLGRSFSPDEEVPTQSDVVVLTYGFWRSRFGGDASVIGRTLPMEGYDHATRRVIGVLPASFQPLHQEPDVYIPLHLFPGHTVSTDSTWYVSNVVARLAPGATVERASSEVRAVAYRIREEHASAATDEELAEAGVVPYVDVLVGDSRRTLWVLVGAVGLILLIACANVANLFLARGSRRGSEIGLRKALGATRGRLVVQQLVESGMLALAGGVGGVALGAGLLAVLEPRVVNQLPRVHELGLNPAVLAFAVAATTLAALASGLIPALRSAARDPAEGLRGGTPGVAGRRPGTVLNRSLVAAELALAVMLVTGAALMVRSFRGIVDTDPGFDPAGVITLRVAPPPARYAARDAQAAYQARVLEQIRAVPGVARAGSIQLLPMSQGNWAFPYLAEDHLPPDNAPLPVANFRVVSPGYFPTLRIPILRGRDFTGSDDAGAPDVGITNRAFAEELWPGEDAVGKVIRLFGSSPFTVVGVVGDVRQMSLERDPEPEMYMPMAQFPLASTQYMVRADAGLDPESLIPGLQNAIWSVDDDVPIPSLGPLADVVAESVATQRLTAGLLSGFGLLALLLGAIGVYGVMAYVAAGRAREFAIRTALGAGRRQMVREALVDSAPALGVGLLLGLAGALAAGRVMTGLLHDIEPNDPATLAGVVALLAGVSLLASWLPARRAARAEAAAVLRE